MVTRFRHLGVTLTVAVAIVVCSTSPTAAQVTATWTGAVDSNFFNDDNWDPTSPGAPDTLLEYGEIDSTDSAQVAIIDATTGAVDLNGMSLGFFAGGGNVIQNGGVLNFDAFNESKFGGDGPLPSSWIMNGDAALLYDEPASAGGGGYGSDGPDGADFDVGNGASVMTFELNDNAVLRISDDMKIADNGAGTDAFVTLNGNSQITAGSGTSMGNPGYLATLTIADNALYVSGNSAGPGDTANGRTNEGYLATTNAEILVKDSGRFWIRTLQARGQTNITVQDNASFDIFDVFFNNAPDLGNATVEGDAQANERTSFLAESPGQTGTITIKGNGTFTVDSNVGNTTLPWSGLAMSGGQNRGGNSGGGTSLIDVQDQGTFIVQQNLNMTMGGDANAASTLKVTGPDATVQVNGDLLMAIDPNGNINPGSATLQAVITGAEHTTIEVGGSADISNGSLAVELDGFTPNGGESYTLLTAASGILGLEFLSTDFSLAPLPEELDWELQYLSNSIVLNVLGMLDFTPGDFDKNGVVDGNDFLAWQQNFGTTEGATQAQGDADGNGTVDGNDFLVWQANFGSGVGGGSAAVPEPSSVVAGLCLLGGTLSLRRRRN